MNIRTPLLDNDIVDLMCRVPHENSNIKDLLLALNSSGVDFFSESRTGLKTYFKTFYNSIKINNRRANRCYCEELNSNNNWQFCSWYRKELSTLVKDILYDNRSLDRSYIDKKVIKKFIDDHIQGKQNYTKEITLLLTVELIYRVFIDQK